MPVQKHRPGRVGKSDFQKVKTEHFRAFVSEDSQSVERKDVLRTASRNENPEITEWYSVEDIQEKYGMTLSAIYSLVSKIGIPKRKEGPKVYYSKYHFDVAKGAKSAEDVEFISVADAMEKYSLTRDQLYHYVKTYKITKLRCGKYVKLNVKELEALFNPEIRL